jgi:HSP20 family protein
MLTLWNQFDDLFANDDRFRWPARSLERNFLPAVDIRESKEAYLLTADVPGLSADDVDISVKDGVLTVKGERRSEKRTSEAGYHRVERTLGSFQRSFVLPKGVSSERIDATVAQGVLTVAIPKPVAATPQKIQVRAHGPEPHAEGSSPEGGKKAS